MTNETKHTPGKMWQVYERYPNSYAIANCDEDGVRTDIAWLGKSASRINEVNLANARLIAYAPELLEALEEMLEHYCPKCYVSNGLPQYCKVCDVLPKYKQLIARGKGGNP